MALSAFEFVYRHKNILKGLVFKLHLPAVSRQMDAWHYLALTVFAFLAGAFLAGLFLAVLAVMLPFPLLHAMGFLLG